MNTTEESHTTDFLSIQIDKYETYLLIMSGQLSSKGKSKNLIRYKQKFFFRYKQKYFLSLSTFLSKHPWNGILIKIIELSNFQQTATRINLFLFCSQCKINKVLKVELLFCHYWLLEEGGR